MNYTDDETTADVPSTAATGRRPIVGYLDLAGEPHLVVNECAGCGARFFDRRNACASCSGTEFVTADLPRHGTVQAYTIIDAAAPGVTTPFVAALVDCGGTSVRANLLNIDPSPERVAATRDVKLTTFAVGRDTTGVDAISFGFEPA